MVEVILIWHSPHRFFSMAIQGLFLGSVVHIMNSGLHSCPNSDAGDVQKLQWDYSDGILPEETRDNEDWEQQPKKWATAKRMDCSWLNLHLIVAHCYSFTLLRHDWVADKQDDKPATEYKKDRGYLKQLPLHIHHIVMWMSYPLN